VPQSHWLQFSIGVQPAGAQLFGICSRLGLEQKVRQPTRGSNLLDLALTDASSGVSCTVLPKIADHKLVLTKMAFKVAHAEPVERQVLDYSRADWAGLKQCLRNTNWREFFFDLSADEAAQRLTDYITEKAAEHIPSRTQVHKLSSHPWLNEKCFELIKAKVDAEGTDDYDCRQQECTAGLLAEYEKYILRMKAKLSALKPSSKKWWKLGNSLQLRANQNSAIPPIKSDAGAWCLQPAEKANAFADSFASKFFLPEAEENAYTEVQAAESAMSGFFIIKENAKKVLKQLREDSGTGPDLLAAKILKKCADELAKPVALLVRIILDTGCWPMCWKLHWIYPLHKRGARSLPKQYRGIHLTAQLSKVAERILGQYWCPYLEKSLAYGNYQFAYIPHRSYRDALCFNVCTWLWALATRKRVGLYCSDVSGAFDRVNAERLIMKLRARGVHERMLKVLQSWLSDRTAYVCVEGVQSIAFVLQNMVFQGTVSGPSLWNTYYADANRAVESCEYTGTVFADDLNCFKVFDGSIGNAYINSESKRCQQALHVWGRAN